MGEPAKYGLDAAVPAAFLALLWPRLDSARKRLVAVAAGALALSLVPVTSPGLPVIAAAGIAVLAALQPDRGAATSEPAAGEPGSEPSRGER